MAFTTSPAESRALSPDRIYRFIFAPGFSTAATVTETSGRGVGMDVVMHTVTRLGGRTYTADRPTGRVDIRPNL